MRLNFKPKLVEDVKQGAFIKLWKDYERHHDQWNAKPESFWGAVAKLGMRWTNRGLSYPISYVKVLPTIRNGLSRFSTCSVNAIFLTSA
jgi:hypothetical protein